MYYGICDPIRSHAGEKARLGYIWSMPLEQHSGGSRSMYITIHAMKPFISLPLTLTAVNGLHGKTSTALQFLRCILELSTYVLIHEGCVSTIPLLMVAS